ncbi:MAG: hypothetical protein ACPL7J_06205, partial [Desulfomonilaceae bacterium]
MDRHRLWLIGTAVVALALGNSVWAQWTDGQDYSSSYNTSSLIQAPSGSLDGSSPPIYYPDWYNY